MMSGDFFCAPTHRPARDSGSPPLRGYTHAPQAGRAACVRGKIARAKSGAAYPIAVPLG